MEVSKSILLVDDERLFCRAVTDILGADGVVFSVAHTIAEGLELYRKSPFDIALLDGNLPDGKGLDLARAIFDLNDQAKIIMVTGYPSYENAVAAMRCGVCDYLAKPIDPTELRLRIRSQLHTIDLERVEMIHRYQSRRESEESIVIGSGKAFGEIHRLIPRLAATDVPVLLTGETGTGKTQVAKTLHFAAGDPGRPFLSINCAALPESLVDLELFGAEKGAYTGADRTRKGIFELAEGGTLFLDEIGEMPLALQSKLLTVIEERVVRRIGGDVTRPVNVRIVAATNRDIDVAARNGTFRPDLFYRLNVAQLRLPALRERVEDIPELCAELLRRIAPGRPFRIADDEMDRLMAYGWPGNIRELRNLLERCLIVQEGNLLRPSRLLPVSGETVVPVPPEIRTPDPAAIPLLETVERDHILKAFELCGYHQVRTAQAIGLSLSTLRRKLLEYGVRGTVENHVCSK